MKRKQIIKEIGDLIELEIDYNCGDHPTCIDEIIEWLKIAEDNGATHIKIYSYNHGSYIDVQPVNVKYESDEEFEMRKLEQDSRNAAAENVKNAKEKALYEELKLKYDKL